MSEINPYMLMLGVIFVFLIVKSVRSMKRAEVEGRELREKKRLLRDQLRSYLDGIGAQTLVADDAKVALAVDDSKNVTFFWGEGFGETFSPDDILDVEIIEDHLDKRNVYSVMLRIIVNDTNNPVREIYTMKRDVQYARTDSERYRQAAASAQHWKALLTQVLKKDAS